MAAILAQAGRQVGDSASSTPFRLIENHMEPGLRPWGTTCAGALSYGALYLHQKQSRMTHAVVNYVRTHFGNEYADTVTVEEVRVLIQR